KQKEPAEDAEEKIDLIQNSQFKIHNSELLNFNITLTSIYLYLRAFNKEARIFLHLCKPSIFCRNIYSKTTQYGSIRCTIRILINLSIFLKRNLNFGNIHFNQPTVLRI